MMHAVFYIVLAAMMLGFLSIMVYGDTMLKSINSWSERRDERKFSDSSSKHEIRMAELSAWTSKEAAWITFYRQQAEVKGPLVDSEFENLWKFMGGKIKPAEKSKEVDPISGVSKMEKQIQKRKKELLDAGYSLK